MSWESIEGSTAPLGATWIAEEQAYNFALYSNHASRVTLLLYTTPDVADPVFTYSFDPFRNKTGPVWHARISKKDLADAEFYAYSVDGPSGEASEGNAFRPEKILLDPYAREVFFPPSYDRIAATGRVANAGKAPLGVLCGHRMPFDWGKDRHPRHDEDFIIYELHVRGFTMNPNSGVTCAHRGTFSGIIEKIPYLRELGITAVELMPVFQFDDTEPNYWGYMPLNFFAPHHRYLSESGRSKCEGVREFRELVKALHAADIEVILDVVYNHTTEGNERGPTLSFKGIDNATYYMRGRNASHPYADYTGAGNTLNCAHPAVRQLILESLRYWVTEMHVDGFRFDLASVFSRDARGKINFEEPPIFGDIASDPDLRGIRLIAEPWEGNSEYPNYELGFSAAITANPMEACCAMPACPSTPTILQRSFPGIGWRQWNDKFRNTLRHFVKSDPGFVGDLMTRLYGSSDVFPDAISDSCRPYQSVNYIDSHDGFTLYDLVAYNSAESWNCGDGNGDEGIGPEVMRLRKQQVKNFCCLLMLSNGTPMFRAGDEFLQTQSGQNNPWNVDDVTTWLDWGRLTEHKDIFRFFQKMIALRKAHPSIARPVFWRSDAHWHGVSAQPDLSYESRTLAFYLDGGVADSDLYVIASAYWEPLRFIIQEGQAREWRRIIDTSRASPADFLDADSTDKLNSPFCLISPRSVVVLIKDKFDSATRPAVEGATPGAGRPHR